jgi:hypothetical protein
MQCMIGNYLKISDLFSDLFKIIKLPDYFSSFIEKK